MTFTSDKVWAKIRREYNFPPGLQTNISQKKTLRTPHLQMSYKWLLTKMFPFLAYQRVSYQAENNKVMPGPFLQFTDLFRSTERSYKGNSESYFKITIYEFNRGVCYPQKFMSELRLYQFQLLCIIFTIPVPLSGIVYTRKNQPV